MNKRLMVVLMRLYLIKIFPYREFNKFYSKDAENILWLYSYYPQRSKKYFLIDLFHDTCLLIAFLKQKKKFRILFGNKILNINNKTIYFNCTRYYSGLNEKDYTLIFKQTLKKIKNKNNVLFPKIHEVELWENKAFMHQQFKKLGIPHPETTLLRSIDKIPLDLEFPILIKEVHSAGSKGIYKINSQSELVQKLEGIFKNEDVVLLQKLINMRKDMRVIIIGNEIVLHYWRINNSKEWKPTSTSRGSDTDFDFFPEQWRSNILEKFKLLGITTGAFDITWQNDDLKNHPLYLEVSPSYMPNPPLPKNIKNKTYGEYKTYLFTKNAYYKMYTHLAIDLKAKLIDAYTNNRFEV